ncbi:MAG: hypothetical protein PUB95_02435 [Methanobrevibacter ruminantium]|uniref:hypothetical protein n=1 Tax=Methanobrevibacter ruminantium TaxID=83816 RepID=UPI0026EEB18C|nr:hypothetical protein [Methanobrevibacter ruminantium]MDD6048302.1 hypothetical protein [Methanobrevibacter ruminantium]
MNCNLFLIILIALIPIFLIILYNGIRLFLTVEKEKGIVKYEFKVTMLKIAIFTRKDTKEIIDSIMPKKDEDSEENEAESESEEEAEEKDEKGLKEKYEEIKPILKELKKSKEELKSFLKDILKAIDLKKLEGNLIIGLSDHTTTVKIASWIWSIGAIVNSSKPTLLTVEPRFNEVITDFEGKIELKINILLLLIYSLVLLTKKNIRELIKELYRQKKSKDKKEKESINDNSQKEENN